MFEVHYLRDIYELPNGVYPIYVGNNKHMKYDIERCDRLSATEFVLHQRTDKMKQKAYSEQLKRQESVDHVLFGIMRENYDYKSVALLVDYEWQLKALRSKICKFNNTR